MTNESPAPPPSDPIAAIDEHVIRLAVFARDRDRDTLDLDGQPPVWGHLTLSARLGEVAAAILLEDQALLQAAILLEDQALLQAAILLEDQALLQSDNNPACWDARQAQMAALASLAGDALLMLAYLVAHTCGVCGCTDEAGCPEGCYWLEPGLCSSCGPGAVESVAGQTPEGDGV